MGRNPTRVPGRSRGAMRQFGLRPSASTTAAATEIIQTDLMIHWKVFEGTGSTIADASEESNDTLVHGELPADFWDNTSSDGTAVGTFVGPTAGAYLDSVSDILSLPPQDGTGITLMAALYPDSLSDGATYYAWDCEAGCAYLVLNFTAPSTYDLEAAWYSDDGNGGTWHKAAGTHPGDVTWALVQVSWNWAENDVIFYVNNTDQEATWDNDPTGVDIFSMGANHYIMAANAVNATTGAGSEVQWKGQAGDFALWESKLTAANMTTNYNALKNKYGI